METVRVLVVEDNPGDVLLIEEALEDASTVHRRFVVVGAPDLAEAARALCEQRPDVVMLDLNLPDSTGLDTVRRVRGLSHDVPIVVMSGTSSEAGFEAMALGAQDYLLKGEVSPPQLHRALHQAMSRQATAVRLQESESRFHSLFSHARVPMVCVATNGAFIEANESFCELTGYSRDDLLQMQALDLAPLPMQELGISAFRALDDGADASTFEVDLVRADGTIRHVLVTAGSVRDAVGAMRYLSAVVHDVTVQREAQRLAVASERRFHSLVEHVSDVISVHDHEGRLLFTSPSGFRLLGLEHGAIPVGADVLEFVHEEDRGRLALAFGEWLIGASYPIQFRVARSDGAWVQCETVATNLLDDPAVGGVVLTTRDVSDRQRALEDLSYQAMHDALTGLPNRSLFHDRLSQAIARHRRTGSMLGVLFVDLDNFKYINDSHGHQVGDEVLLAASAVLAASIRPADTIARLGGDEFAIVCEDIEDVETAQALAQRVQDVLRTPFTVGDLLIHVTASIGIAMAGVDGVEYSATDVLRDADAALYQAKDRGRARAEVFDDELRRRAVRRLKVEEALRSALAADELEVRYQPQFAVGSGVLTGFEALLRWTHPSLGVVAPDEFIPIAEAGGLIHPIGRWVLDQACAQLATWRDRYPALDATMAVNLSARQVADEQLIDAVGATVERHGLDPSALCLEVTESVLMEDAPSSVAMLRRLKELGVRIAIDDFGTGYSSLAYLKRFPVDYLKVDRTFVAGLGHDPEDTVIVASVIDLAGRLGLMVVAEGVETQAQLDELNLLGCGYAQGYLRGAAVVPDEAEWHLRRPIGPKAAAVGEAVELLARRAEEARYATAGVDEAVEMLANELRTPITVIRGFAETLEELVGQGREDVLHRAVVAITRQASGMESLLTSLVDVRRADDGALGLRCRPTDVAAAVERAIVAVAGAGFVHRLDLEAGPCPAVSVDRDRIGQTLVQLLTNAVQHSPADAPVTVVVEFDAATQMVGVRVIDCGPGVADARVPELFRKFSRLGNTRKGSGLGLYLARSIARAHGGDVRYRRAETGGAEFVLTLPTGTQAGGTGASFRTDHGALRPMRSDEPTSTAPVTGSRVAAGPAAVGLLTLDRPPTAHSTDVDDEADEAESLLAARDAARALLRATTPEEVVGVAIDLVHRLGGRTVDAASAGPDAIPVDLSFGVGDPRLPVGEPGLARMRLERTLPSFVEDARAAVRALRYQQRLEGDASTDIVTGLCNASGLAVWSAQSSLSRTVGLLVLDCLDLPDGGDGSTRGAESDRVRRELSRTVRGLLGAGDVAVRSGPDEVAVVSSRRSVPDMAELVRRVEDDWMLVRPAPVHLSCFVAPVTSPDVTSAIAAARGGHPRREAPSA